MKVFVYGTLRKDQRNHYNLQDSRFIGEGYVLGTLYSIRGKDYPALLLNSKRLIKGEIYDISESTLVMLDSLEDYHPTDLKSSLYVRELVEIVDENKNVIDYGFVYFYNDKNYDELEVIESNDFVIM